MNNLIQNYFSLVNAGKRYIVLDSIRTHEEIDFKDIRILNYLWQLRYGSKSNCTIVKDLFLNAFLEILSLDSEVLPNNQWKLNQQKLFQDSCLLGLEDYQFQSPDGKHLFILEYANFTAFYLQFGKKEDLYDASSRIPEQFGLYQIFAPLRSGIDKFFQAQNQ